VPSVDRAVSVCPAPRFLVYNSLNQLTTVGNDTSSAAYANTPAGSITENTAGSTLAYNSAEQLTSLTPGAGPSTTYGYDDNGNRTSSTVGATATTAASTTSYTYDPAGNLTAVAIPSTGSNSAKTVDYTSDGDGLRQSHTVGSATTNFLWDTNGSLPILLDDGTYSSLYGPSSAPIAEVNDSTGSIRYLTDDLVGSTRLITSSTGSVVGVNTYDEYGNLSSQTGSASSPFGYSGNWTDADTGLLYLRARDYDSSAAQFLGVDPFVDTTRQPYAYVADDPLDQTDSDGASGSSAQSPGNDANVWNLGWEWLTGTGPRNQVFHNGDPLTNNLEQDDQIKSDVNQVRSILASQGSSVRAGEAVNPLSVGGFDNELGGWDGVEKYASDATSLVDGGLTGNQTGAYLGSFGVKVKVVQVCDDHSAVVRFTVNNASTLGSALHLPFYSELEAIGLPTNQLTAFEDSLPGKTGPLSKTTQTIIFTQRIKLG
jgi:RHS repeat-associated protein